MLGTVISADMDLISQLQPNMPCKFISVTMEQALAARADRNTMLANMQEALA